MKCDSFTNIRDCDVRISMLCGVQELFVVSVMLAVLICKLNAFQILDLQTAIQDLTAWSQELNRSVSLSDICFKPLSPDNEMCTIMSILNYFQNSHSNIDHIQYDEYGFDPTADYLSHFTICTRLEIFWIVTMKVAISNVLWVTKSNKLADSMKKCPTLDITWPDITALYRHDNEFRQGFDQNVLRSVVHCCFFYLFSGAYIFVWIS